MLTVLTDVHALNLADIRAVVNKITLNLHRDEPGVTGFIPGLPVIGSPLHSKFNLAVKPLSVHASRRVRRRQRGHLPHRHRHRHLHDILQDAEAGPHRPVGCELHAPVAVVRHQ